ncbi:MAG: hypothetical protein ACLFVH_14775 [Phycisphaerae bacterium]
MALFSSTQSGNWHDPLTWDVGAVPDLGSDDVMIADGHEVVFESGYNDSLDSGRLIAVAANGTLRIQGGIDASDAEVVVLGTLIAEGDYFAVWGGTELQIDPGGNVTINSSLFLESVGTATVEGVLEIAASGDMNVYRDGTLTVATGGVCDQYGYGYIEDNSRVYVHGDLQVNSGGTLSIAYYVFMAVEQDGVALIYGTLAAEWDGLIDVHGYLAIHQDGYLRVYSYAQINVYNDIRVSGRMTGGGKVLMLRREGRILDFNDNPIFVLDRAYGFGQTQIA